ncbi:MAG: arginase [Elusimicrobia bacterium]|nr:arginase [Elusimicrobiota bacterium]
MAKKIALIGVPMDLGASTRGSAGGPAAIRRTELAKRLAGLGLTVEDRGDIAVPARPPKAGQSKMKYAAEIREACRTLARETHAAVRDGWLPVALGGDHSLAMGSAAGVSKYFHAEGEKIGLLWVDAHGDMNTPATTPSGNVHGMPLAHLVGLGERGLNRIAGFSPAVDPSRACLIGIRDLDEAEKENIRRCGVRVFTMADIDRRGLAHIVEQAIDHAGENAAGLHVSFDIDAADPSIAEGVGTKKRGGLTYREAHLLMEIVAESKRMVSLDMVEVNPLEDSHNTTAELASELVQSALGKRIY